jgi:hypothetical protein
MMTRSEIRMHSTPTVETRSPPAAAEAVVATSMIFDAPAAEVWQRLMFYEQIDERPPLHLRMLLPVPIETKGRKSEVGDEVHCRYEGGYLIKRVTQIEPGQRYAFEIVEQALAVGSGVMLAGGEYALRDVASRRTEICITTHYTSPRRPRWLWLPIERVVCHSFHRHILRAMRRGVTGGSRPS